MNDDEIEELKDIISDMKGIAERLWSLPTTYETTQCASEIEVWIKELNKAIEKKEL